MTEIIGKLGKKEGILLRRIDGATFFRENKEGGGFTDYEILHSDLSIIINDDDACIYKNEGQLIIDHSPATLGINE